MTTAATATLPRTNAFSLNPANLKLPAFLIRSRREALSPGPMSPHQKEVMTRAINLKIRSLDKLDVKSREIAVMHLKDFDNQFWYGFLGRMAAIFGGIVFMPFIMAGAAVQNGTLKIRKSALQNRLDRLLGVGAPVKLQRKIDKVKSDILFWQSVQKGSANALNFYYTERYPATMSDISSNWFIGAEQDDMKTIAYAFAGAVYPAVATFHGIRWLAAKGTEFSLKMHLNNLEGRQSQA